ncbi:alpha/beta hydrolase [Chelatococcus asaccharovorans]|uniref:Acetyl esterase n=1 Tax=Chelatococcus asaccharovorans TaxID=28210 RepID=A0A2V3UUH4_9HYPH|nr:alpha/beta hydrolase [Chelatococcus asaccharovorans]MBS7701924.1 alpha/beta hydrolase [Chelatococcus asaccharovorans]PXW64368.1 acetyl esterase [Chelatococcus asaccharovorans]
MTLDADIAAFLARLPAPEPASLEAIRAETDRVLLTLQGAPEAVDRIEDLAADDPASNAAVPIRAYWPAGSARGQALPALVFAHAGGWCLVSLETYDTPCRALANATGCVVFSVDYRLAPEHPYPAPLEDFYRALVWVADHAEALGIDAGRIAVAGDSAGANLAAGAALLARDRRGPSIAHQLLIYPPVDTDLGTASYEAFGDGYYLTRETMRFCWEAYLGEGLASPPVYAAPLRADLSNLPPSTVMVNEYDPLRSEGEAYARKLAESGVPTRLILLEGMVHGCIHMAGVAPAAGGLFVRAGEAIRTGLQPPPVIVASENHAAAGI